jgi:3-oxoacyl-[acyl-carrier protein] reductase
MRLRERVTLITGGAAGIGKATAERFAEEGARVVICDLTEETGQKIAEAIGGEFYRVDVRDRQAVQAWVDEVVSKHGRIDVLVNNAGIVRDHQLVKYKEGQLVGQMPESDFDLVVSVILNATSVVGLDGNFGQTNYVATKAGVIGMTKVWARELGKYGIRVNAVAPGFTSTEILKSMPEKIIEGMKAHTPLGRMGDPRDIANAYLFLASDEASFITGETLRVDGGLVAET